MSTNTALSLTRAARVAADVVDRGLAAGLSGHISLTAKIDWSAHRNHHEAAQIMCYGGRANIDAWAAFLGVEVAETVTEAAPDQLITFWEAEATVDGVVIALDANQRTAVAR